MKKSCSGLMLLLFCSTVLAEARAELVLASPQSGTQRAALPVSATTEGALFEQASDLFDPRARGIEPLFGVTAKANFVAKRTKRSKGNPKSNRRKSRRAKSGKKITPRAVVQPRLDLVPHGMIEGPQRYDPRPNYRTAGVRDPQTRDLIHDHFQELDRNQDGRVDPVERAFGRLDIDRDLSSRSFR